MSRKAVGGIDNRGQRLMGVATPTASDDGVPKGFIRYDLPFQCINVKPAAGEVIGMLVLPADLTAGIILPVNLLGSIARALVAATAAATWTLSRIPAGSSTETAVATVTFAAGATLGTFSSQAAIPLAAGDLLRLKAPATADSTLAEITFTFVALR